MRAVAALLASAILLLVGCGSRSDPARLPAAAATTSAPPLSVTPPPPASATRGTLAARTPSTARVGTEITVGASQYGPVLFDRTGQAIYVFDAEKTSAPSCYEECAHVWPPVLTPGPPVAAGSVGRNLLGVTTRADGRHQVTYRGRPLYYYAREGKHQVLCHNVSKFGGRWLAITTAGVPAPT